MSKVILNRVFHLIAILPPGNVARKIIDIQKELFYRYGKTAGLALPPFIPVAFLKKTPSDSLFSKPLTTEDPVTYTSQWAVEGEACYLRTSNFKTWKKMQHIFGGGDRDSPQLVPLFPGFFIYLDQDEDSKPVSLETLPEIPALTWKTSRIAVICIETQTYPHWWENVLVTIKRESKLRMS